MIKLFIEWLGIRNNSKSTIDNYGRILRDFNSYLSSCGLNLNDPEGVKYYHIDQRIAIQRIKKTIKTCNLYVGCIRSFFRFCLYMERKVIDYKGINFSKEPQRNIEYLRDEQIESIFQKIKERKTSTKKQEIIKIRDLCIVKLLFYTGLRVSELLNLKREDLQDEIVQIVGKGGIHRVVFINRGTEERRLLDYYLRLRKDSEKYVFISFSKNGLGEKLSRNAVEKMVKKVGEECGFKLHPHLFRHSFATKLMRKDVNLIHIQKLLGHKNIQTTQQYISCLDNELQKSQQMVLEK